MLPTVGEREQRQRVHLQKPGEGVNFHEGGLLDASLQFADVSAPGYRHQLLLRHATREPRLPQSGSEIRRVGAFQASRHSRDFAIRNAITPHAIAWHAIACIMAAEDVSMFMTTPAFEQWVPPAIAIEGAKFWRGLYLELELPWFLVRARFESDGGQHEHTLAFAWESAVLSFVQEMKDETIASLYCIALGETRNRIWQMERITELWLPAETERDDTGPLLMRFWG